MKFKSKSESLSLALVENATPLSIDYNGARLRRSPRFTTSATTTTTVENRNGGSSTVELTPKPKPKPKPKKNGGSVELMTPKPKGKDKKKKQLRLRNLKDRLRRSPRVNSAPATVGDGNAGRFPRFSPGPRHSVKRQRSSGPEVPLNNGLKDKKSTLNEENSSRRSLTLCRSASPPQQMLVSHSSKHSNGKLSGGKHLRQTSLNSSPRYRDVRLFPGMTVRRSPRLSSLVENGKQVIAIQDKRSSTISVHRKNAKSKMNSTRVDMSESANKHSRVVQTMSTDSSSDANTSLSLIQDNRTACSDSFASIESDCDTPAKKKYKTSASLTNENESLDQNRTASFIGDPISDDEARKRWGWRYELKDKACKNKKFKINENKEDEIIVNVESHYARAEVENCIYSLGDCALVEGKGEVKHVGKIVEFFQTTDRQNYFRVQWFYRIHDTVVQDQGGFHDKRRLFYSTVMNDNLIDCIVAKANVTHLTPRVGLKLTSISSSDFYYDMGYSVDYTTFHNITTDNPVEINELKPHAVSATLSSEASKNTKSSEVEKTELALLDLYAGCGGMSTGLCYGAKVSSVNLVTRWAVDSDRSASESLKLNHPETQVRNESAEDFLDLLKEWEKLCKRYKVNDTERAIPLRKKSPQGGKKQANSQGDDDEIPDGELEVSKFVDICYGDPSETGKRGLYFKVHWKGYSSSEDTWEPIENLRKCKDVMQDFVKNGVKSRILPLPGEVDVICGGPPCQGISGYNRFRNTESPLDDERNRQIVVFMDIVKYLKPKYVLMENVVDILRFDGGSLGRYALSRLVHMNYQARLGIVAAGCYGLPQFRLRVFLWGAHPDEILPQFPLPSHDVIVKYWPPMEFMRNVVAYNEDQPRGALEKACVIQDAISDLPPVANNETRDEMSYENPPETGLQRYIRSTEYEMTGLAINGTTEKKSVLYDHRPCLLFEDDYQRVCQIPKRKGANFRDLPGVVVGADNVARRHPTENIFLPSGKPLVPDYVLTYEHGKSKRPFSRLWWDETLPTALTVPSCHNQTILHPEQDRILTIREFARLQGFPDYYRFYGNVKERYCQIGNAVAVSVSRALGYSLGMAYRKLSGNEPLMTLPPQFSHSNYIQLSDRGPSISVDTSHVSSSDNQLTADNCLIIAATSDDQMSVNPARDIIASSDDHLMAPSMGLARDVGLTAPLDNLLTASSVDPALSASIIAPSNDDQHMAPSMDPAHDIGLTPPSDNLLTVSSGNPVLSTVSSEDPVLSASIVAPSQHVALSMNPALRASITAPLDNLLTASSMDPAPSTSIIALSNDQHMSPSMDPALSASMTALPDNQLITASVVPEPRTSIIAASMDLARSTDIKASDNNQLTTPECAHRTDIAAQSDNRLIALTVEPAQNMSIVAPSNHQVRAPSVDTALSNGITTSADNQPIAPSVDSAWSTSIVALSNNQLMAALSVDPASSDNQPIASSVDSAWSASIVAPSNNQLMAPPVYPAGSVDPASSDNQPIAPSVDYPAVSVDPASSDNQPIAPSVDSACSASVVAPSNNQLMALPVDPALSIDPASSYDQLTTSSVDPAWSASIVASSNNQLMEPSIEGPQGADITKPSNEVLIASSADPALSASIVTASNKQQLLSPSMDVTHSAGITDNQLIAPSVDPAQSASSIAPSDKQLIIPSLDPAHGANITAPFDNAD